MNKRRGDQRKEAMMNGNDSQRKTLRKNQQLKLRFKRRLNKKTQKRQSLNKSSHKLLKSSNLWKLLLNQSGHQESGSLNGERHYCSPISRAAFSILITSQWLIVIR